VGVIGFGWMSREGLGLTSRFTSDGGRAISICVCSVCTIFKIMVAINKMSVAAALFPGDEVSY